MKFDLISDIHIDFYVNICKPEYKMRRRISEFVTSILPDVPSDTLAICGDIGHYNSQNVMLLEELRKHYQNIVLVFGNHDLYLVSNNARGKYRRNSLLRLEEMKVLASAIEGVYILDGNVVELDGIKFGGCIMWYDFSYVVQELGLKIENAKYCWRTESNDSRLIAGFPLNVTEMFEKEKSKFDNILCNSDVILTHVGGEWSHCDPRFKTELSTSLYYFDGKPWMNKLKGKIWCFGHDHYRRDYTLNDCRYVNGALGYPDENNGCKIVTVT